MQELMRETQILQFPSLEIVEKQEKKTAKDTAKTRKKSYNINNTTDLQNMMKYFLDTGRYIHYLLFVMGLSFGRRISDTLNFTWGMFYNVNGTKKKYLRLKNEQKTGKAKDILITEAVWQAIRLYSGKTGCQPWRAENRDQKISLQLSGTHKGKELSYEAYRQALKKAAAACGIEQNIGSHTTRKTAGYFAKKLHPTDEFSTSVISEFLNHSSESVTRSYIGLTQEQEDRYVSDMSDMLVGLMNGETPKLPDVPTDLVTIEYDDLRQIIQMVYQLGRENSGETDLQKHLDNIDGAMELVRTMMK